MNKILVSGLINVETTLKIDSFPVKYSPVRYPFFGINTTVSGVGLNVAKALTCLGDEVNLVSLTGDDFFGVNIKKTLLNIGVDTKYLVDSLNQTPQSIILYDDEGRRQINVDLKDIQEKEYPIELFNQALSGVSIAVLCNINFSRPFLKLAKENNILIATDVHVLSNIYDEYNKDFMKYANILFLSSEGITERVEDFARKIVCEYNNDILVIGLGKEGALLYVKEDNFMDRFPAVHTREVVNTIGAGDALFSCFIHFYSKTKNPYESLKKAIVFASYKIGARGAAEGFLSEEELDLLYKKIYKL
jgi:ribokinase